MKQKNSGNWFNINMLRKKKKEGEPKPEKDKGRQGNILYSLITIIVLAVFTTLYAFDFLDSFTTYTIVTIFVTTRIVVYIVEKMLDDQFWLQQTKKGDLRLPKLIFLIRHIAIIIGLISLFNMIYAFELWVKIFLASRWIDDIFISLVVFLSSLIIYGCLKIIDERWAFKRISESLKGEARKIRILEKANQLAELFGFFITLVLIPLVILIATFIYVPAIQLEFDANATTVFQGQVGGIDDWFAYVFFILFQDDIPALMIAFMGISSIAVILAQNLAEIGRVVSGVATGVIAIIPMLFVLSAFSGSIPPPEDLTDVVGLSDAIASFIYGLGLMLTYITMVSIMSTFILSSRALGSDFG